MEKDNLLMGKCLLKPILLFIVVLFLSHCTTKLSKSKNDDSAMKMVPEEYVEMSGGYKIDMSDFSFIFDNVSDENEVLVSFLNQQKAQNKAMCILPTGDTTLASLNIQDTIPNNVFKAFAEYNSVNMWSDERDFGEQPRKKEEVVDKILNEKVALYCGQVMLSDSFDSFMFLLNDTAIFKYGWQSKKLFVVNMKGNSITSVANLFSYKKFDNVIAVQTSRDGNAVFHMIDYDLSGDPCYSDSKSGIIDEFDFKYNRDGQLVILRCPKDYLDEMNRRVELRCKIVK